MARLYRIVLPVSDIERAAALYARLLGMPGTRVSPGRHYFDCGGTILACYDPLADGDGVPVANRPHPWQYLYFGVPDLDATLGLARELGFEVAGDGIRSMPWGERMFWATDPFGNRVSFVDDRTLFLGS